ncbi:MAG: cellulase family glycosylhydrolase [Thermofilaceae archaeon]
MNKSFTGKKMVFALGVIAIITCLILLIFRPYLFEKEEFSRSRLPALYVQENKILDEYGNQIIFHGVNSVGVSEMIYYYGKWDEKYFEKMKEWNVKIVRFPIHYASYAWYEEHKPGYYLRVLDQGIEWAARNGIYSIIDFHSCGWPVTGEYFGGGYDSNWGRDIYAFTPEELKEFWGKVSKYFANDTRIAFYDLFNEPAKEDPNVGGVGDDISLGAWLEWRDFAEELIDIIRKNDPNRVVLVGGLQFSYYVNHAVDYPIRRPNVVYSIHIYNNTNWMVSWDEAFGNASSSIPVLVGEVGFDPEDPNIGGTVENFARPLLDYLEQKSIGWLAWNFSPEWSPKLLLDWNYTPTVSGEFFYEKLHG